MVCSKCVLDTTVEGVTLNADGICNFCVDIAAAPPRNKHSEEELKQLVNDIRQSGKNKKYDCVIGLSGGVDSSYVAYMVKDLGLRPLAVHLDNGWDAEIAVNNIHNICERLNIDLYTHVLDWEEFKDLQKSFLAASVANAETPTDHAIVAILYKMAAKYGIKYLIDGINHATETPRNGFMAGGYTYADAYHIRALQKRFGTKRLKSFPIITYTRKFYYRKILGIKQVSILDYIDYNKAKTISFMQENLGWRSYGGKHHESLFTKFHQTVYLPEKFGFDKRKVHLSDLVLSGQMTHEKALEELSKPPIPESEKAELISYFKKKLNYSDEEYRQLMQAPPVNFDQYPNIDSVYKFVRKNFKWIIKR